MGSAARQPRSRGSRVRRNLGETAPYNGQGVRHHMPRKTRLFFVVAGGVLVVGLGTGLIASYMGLPTFAVVGSDGPAELKLVPVDAKVVAYANVRDVMNSELRQKVRQLHPNNQQPGNFEAETGINIENDIDAVVASI